MNTLLRFFVVLHLWANSGISIGAGDSKAKWYTHWNGPARPKKHEPLDFDASMHLPENPDRFAWELVAGPIDRKANEVAVFTYHSLRRELMTAGYKPVGLSIRIKGLMTHKHIHYYFVVESASADAPGFWVSGEEVKAVAIAPEPEADAAPAH